MEAKVADVLENILGLLALEGSFETVEGTDEVLVTIETDDAGRLIGNRGETIDALQLLVNQIVNKQSKQSLLVTKSQSKQSLPSPTGERKDNEQFKRVVIDVGSWRKHKEEELETKARRLVDEVLGSGKEVELDSMPAWQRRIIHLVVEGIEGVTSESVGEGRERRLIIKPAGQKQKAEATLK